MNRIDYLEENGRVYCDIRDIDAVIKGLKNNALIKVDSNTVELISGIFNSIIDSFDEGSLDEATIMLDDADIVDIQKELNKELDKQQRLLAKAERKVKAKKLKKEIDKQISSVEQEEEEEPEEDSEEE